MAEKIWVLMAADIDLTSIIFDLFQDKCLDIYGFAAHLHRDYSKHIERAWVRSNTSTSFQHNGTTKISHYFIKYDVPSI